MISFHPFPWRNLFGLSFLIAVSLGSPSPARPQELPSDTAAELEAWDEEVDSFLQKHPVKSSALFYSTALRVDAVTRFSIDIIDTCEYAPDLVEWSDALGKLQENTLLALRQSALRSKKELMAKTPPSLIGRPLSRGDCADAKRHYLKIIKELVADGAALRKAGY